ncbi:MAG: hypothetical protein AB7F82_07720 [Alphaproteobacteria bacterium]
MNKLTTILSVTLFSALMSASAVQAQTAELDKLSADADAAHEASCRAAAAVRADYSRIVYIDREALARSDELMEEYIRCIDRSLAASQAYMDAVGAYYQQLR